MTLLVIDGFDNAHTIPKSGFVESPSSSSASVDFTGRDGSTNGSFRTSGTAGSPSSVYNLPTPAATLVLGHALWMSGLGSLVIWYTGGNATSQCNLGINNVTRRWELRMGGTGTVLASSAVDQIYTLSSWVYVEIRLVLHTTTGSFIMRVNEVEIINYTGPTALTSGTVTGMAWQCSPGSSSIATDDLYICDAVDATATQGRAFNAFLGDCKVAAMVPTAAGDTTGWTASTGANWDTLNESPVGTTDYVEKLASASGTRDLYQFSDLPGAAGTVLGVQSRIYDEKLDVGTALIKQVVKESGGTVTTTGTHAPSVSRLPHTSALLTKRPSDGGLWTVANINALQAGVEVA